MEIKLTRNDSPRKTSRLVFFSSETTHTVQFLRTAFGETIPATLTITGDFAQPKPKETPEQRKARIAAMSPAEKIAAAEERIRKAQARLDAQKKLVAQTTTESPKAETTKTAHKAKKG